MKIFHDEEQIEKEFHVSIYILIYKFILGTVEFLAGLTIAIFGSKIYHLYQATLLKELSEDPHDLLAHLSENIVPSLLTHNTYIILYLMVLGLAKMAGAIGLIYRQNWGVDLLVGLTILMAPFQIVNLITHPNLFDLIYFIVGILIASLSHRIQAKGMDFPSCKIHLAISIKPPNIKNEYKEIER